MAARKPTRRPLKSTKPAVAKKRTPTKKAAAPTKKKQQAAKSAPADRRAELQRRFVNEGLIRPPKKKTPTATKRAAGTTKRAAAAPAKARTGLVLKGLPVLWQQHAGGQAIGIHVDDNEVWAGWTTGDVVVCDHDGNVLRRWKLPDGVDALVADDAWRYAGCHDGNVYDLTGRAPRVTYTVEGSARIHWVDVYRGNLVASDAKGNLTCVDADGRLLFRYEQKNGSKGWMARADGSGVYLGNSHGVTKVDWSGKKLWTAKTLWVGFGWQEQDRVFAFCGAYGHGNQAGVVAIDKQSGKIVANGSCHSDEPHYHGGNNAAACAAGRDGAFIFGGTCDLVFCFDDKGALLWESSTAKVGASCSMAYHKMPNGQERLYIVTHLGNLACLDVSDAAITAAKTKAGTTAKARTLAAVEETARVVDDASATDKGVIVECVREGGKLRVKVVSDGYHGDWFCQFPRDIREEGARYLVEEVREASQGGFYRVLGDIKRLRS